MAFVHASAFLVIVVCAYWVFFFGREFGSTLQLYQKGIVVDELFDERPSNHVDGLPVVDDGSRSTVPLIMHRMWRDDSILGGDDSATLPADWAKAFLYCNDLYSHRNWTTILWTDDSLRAFIDTHYPSFLPTYGSYPYDI